MYNCDFSVLFYPMPVEDMKKLYMQIAIHVNAYKCAE